MNEKLLKDLIEYELQHRTDEKKAKTFRLHNGTIEKVQKIATENNLKEADVVGAAIEMYCKTLGV